MRIQFSTATLLLITAVVAIACGGTLAWTRIVEPDSYRWFLTILVAGIPIWAPIAFVAFAIGCKALTVRMVLVFAGIEIAGLALVYWLSTLG